MAFLGSWTKFKDKSKAREEMEKSAVIEKRIITLPDGTQVETDVKVYPPVGATGGPFKSNVRTRGGR